MVGYHPSGRRRIAYVCEDLEPTDPPEHNPDAEDRAQPLRTHAVPSPARPRAGAEGPQQATIGLVRLSGPAPSAIAIDADPEDAPFLYLQPEGRGVGLGNKLPAYALQAVGLDPGARG